MKRRDSRWLLVLLACAALLSLHSASAAEPFRCITADTTISTSYVPVDTFFAYSPGTWQSHEHRDIEFQWSDWYSHDLPEPVSRALNFLGADLANPSRSHNAFNAPVTNIRLIYDMFLGANRALYDSLLTQADSIGFVIGSQFSTPERVRDNAHADVYLYYQGQYEHNWGMYPSAFYSPWEDVSTGHSVGDYVHSNSLMLFGPQAQDAPDTTGTHWTRPNWKWDTIILHEFQHAMPYKNWAALWGRDEIFAAMAEAISGGLYYCWPSDREPIPYAWSLLRWRNYEHWRHLGAYLGFNFRGQDTTRVLPTDSTGTSGFGDDLVWKWARTARGLNNLRDLLSDENCWDCAQESYFDGLSNYERLQLLLHNWRVAEYVNNPALLDGQYGFPQAFGAFSPAVTRGAFQNHYLPCSEDTVSVPPVLTARVAWTAQDTTIVGRRYVTTGCSCGGQPCSRVMALEPFGAEYWVIRSEAALSSGNQDLVIRITPEGISRADNNPQSCGQGQSVHHDGRLMATVVTYANQCDTLWNYPSWADSVFGPQVVDVDSAGRALEFVIQGFGGAAKKAALVVLSLEDGPTSAGDSYGQPPTPEVWLPYRVSFALAKSPYPAPFAGAAGNPVALVQTSATETEPAWSPDGTELAYASTELTPGRKVVRRPVSGGSATKVHDVSEDQYQPDWSPRGDWIAFAQDSSITLSSCRHLLVKNPSTSEVRKLATGKVFCAWPAFQPNGQRLAYACQSRPDTTHSGWSIRRANLDGSSATTLVEFAPGNAPDDHALRSLRWSAAGDSVFFTRNDSLFVVSANGGLASYRGGYASGKNVRTFDLACANGAVAFEEPGAFTSNWFCPTAYHRIALADRSVTPPDIEARFYRTGAEFFAPRWSFDGSRIAYATIQDSASDRDIYIGQVSYDHPPQFVNAPRDTVLPSICSLGDYTRAFSASDPDGEQVDFEGAYLPPGATLTANGQFSWPSPGPPGCEYYSVIRAKDGSGGVAQKVVRLGVAADPTPPAAALDLEPGMGKTSATITWTEVGDDSLTGTACRVCIRYGTSPITEANFFASIDTFPDPGATGEAGSTHCAVLAPGSLDPCVTYYFALKTQDDAGNWSALSNVVSGKTRCSGSTEVYCEGEGLMAQGGSGEQWLLGGMLLEQAGASEAATDALPMQRPLDSASGEARVRLSIPGSSAWALDAVSLEVVDHAGDQQAYLVGNRVLLGKPVAATHASDGSNDSLAAILASGKEVVTAPAGSTWDVDLGGEADATSALLLEAGGGDAHSSAPDSGITVLAQDGAGQWTAIATLAPRARFIPLVVDSTPGTRVRVAFGREYLVRRLGRVEVSGSATPRNLSLASAEHSRLGSVTADLGAVGGSEAVLRPQESVVLSYVAPGVASGQVRDFFLSVRGKRTSVSQLTSARRTVPEAEPRPVSFALHQSEPNPFNRSTRIRFDLPVATAARLEVFDAQGRRVATLADGSFPAGYHSCEWSGRLDGWSRAQPGVYLYRIQAGSFRAQRKMVLLP